MFIILVWFMLLRYSLIMVVCIVFVVYGVSICGDVCDVLYVVECCWFLVMLVELLISCNVGGVVVFPLLNP